MQQAEAVLQLQCEGFSLQRLLLLWDMDKDTWASVVAAHGLSNCGTGAWLLCGILLDQGSNWCPLHSKADSQPLDYQGSPLSTLRKQCGAIEHAVLRGNTSLLDDSSQKEASIKTKLTFSKGKIGGEVK